MTRHPMQFVEIQAGDTILLRQFYVASYVSAFPDPDERESLENMLDYLNKKRDGWYGPNNYHILIALIDGNIVGGAVADYLAHPNVGVMEFMFMNESYRGNGHARYLREEIERILQQDAIRVGSTLDYVVAEMNDPRSTDPARDNMDPVLRAVMWGRWLYRLVDFSYVQPALSPGQKPVRTLRLIARSFAGDAEAMPGHQLCSVLEGYMRWAMRLPCPEKCPEYLEMEPSIDSRVRLLDLTEYAMRDRGSVDKG